jgi:methylase of polypeptide subunit release factors
MINVGTPSAVQFVGKFLRDSGYDVRHLGYELDLSDGLFANFENLDPLLARTEGDSVLAILARLFFVSWPVEERRVRSLLPPDFLAAAFNCGLLTVEAGDIVASASLIPFRSSIIACDSCRTRATQHDMVPGPSASTHLPARLAAGGENETTLDLGTGNGALALEASRYSRKVIGTDINPRTLVYAEFNAALNEVTNVEWRCGDSFAPVAGQRFTRIVANPPFFLSAEKTFIYSDSPMDLDGFSAMLAHNASAYLEEGGFFQMICEWVEIDGESWEQRLRDWTSGSGCDVLVLTAPPLAPLVYAEKRTQEARTMRTDGVEGHFKKQFHYLRDRKVRNVRGGVINMRKRSGTGNWFAAVRTDPAGNDIGPDLRARFNALTYLATTKDANFDLKMRLAPDVVLDKRSVAAFQNAEWQPTTVELVKQEGLLARLRLDESVSSFLPLFDGNRTLAEISAIVEKKLQIDAPEARRRCLELARKLLQSNFVTF